MDRFGFTIFLNWLLFGIRVRFLTQWHFTIQWESDYLWFTAQWESDFSRSSAKKKGCVCGCWHFTQRNETVSW
jgi:hypothetical protein